MTIFSQKALVSDHYESNGDAGPCDLTPEILRGYVDDTNAVLADGGLIPVYGEHVKPDSEEDGPFFKTDPRRSSMTTLGWLNGLTLDGSDLVYDLDITDSQADTKIREGSIRRSSPELDPSFTSPDGKSRGSVMRHVALTSNPRNTKQSEFLEVSQFSLEGAQFMGTTKQPIQQFAFDDPAEDAARKKAAENNPTDDTAVNPPVDGNALSTDEDTPAVPPESPGLMRMILAALGFEVSEGFSVEMSEEDAAALKGALEVVERLKEQESQAAEAEQAAATPTSQIFDMSTATPMEQAMNDRLSKQDKRIEHFEKQEVDNNRQKATAAQNLSIDRCSLPPAVRKILKGRVNSRVMQFDNDGKPAATFTEAEVAQLFDEHIPDSMKVDGLAVAPEHQDPDLMTEKGKASPETQAETDAAVEEQLERQGFAPKPDAGYEVRAKDETGLAVAIH